jgi:hypothetical protein
VPPNGRFAVSLRLPEPEAVHVPPPVPLQVHVHAVSGEGNVSATIAAGALLGPLAGAAVEQPVVLKALIV